MSSPAHLQRPALTGLESDTTTTRSETAESPRAATGTTNNPEPATSSSGPKLDPLPGSVAFVEASQPSGECASGFFVRPDAAEQLKVAMAEISARGGMVTSHGGLRPLSFPLTANRIPTSLHYLGRAIDLCITSGMQGPADPYVILHDGDMDGFPLWRVLCHVRPGSVGSRAFSERQSLDGLTWTGTPTGPCTPQRRVGAFVDITARFEACSWQRIPARLGWETKYMAVEWWHFEYREGLKVGSSTFGEELLQLYGGEAALPGRIARCLDYVWNGRRFEPAST
jgi:D-alanyl-D-alanine dipeptidase